MYIILTNCAYNLFTSPGGFYERSEFAKQRQKEGITSAKNKGVKFGRPKLEVNTDNFECIYKQWKDKKIKGIDAMKKLNMTKATFYRRVKEYEYR